jgi:hypothetical protein
MGVNLRGERAFNRNWAAYLIARHIVLPDLAQAELRILWITVPVENSTSLQLESLIDFFRDGKGSLIQNRSQDWNV